MGNTKDFFKVKKEWSEIKDSILDYYLTPYFPIIISTGKPLTIIDCFAGKGRFDDGNIGSPIIISEKIKSHYYNKYSVDINGIFIEKKYYKELKDNLIDYKFSKIWDGSFEDNFDKILNLRAGQNVFIYIDPYGIKSLDFKKFREIRKMDLYSLEMLINFNTVGFFREGFRLLKIKDPTEFDEKELEYEYDENNNINNMNRIADGNYWQSILRNYKKNRIAYNEAEELFIKEYVKRLGNLFKYVVNTPIKIKTKSVPKYRMVFCTNNVGGVLLMVNNMHKKWEEILKKQNNGQLTFFEFDFPGFSDLGFYSLKEKILKALKKIDGLILLNDFLAELVKTYGILFLTGQYEQILRELWNTKNIEVIHDPPNTPTGQKPSALSYNSKGYKIYLRFRNEK